MSRKPLTKIQKFARGKDCHFLLEGCSPGPDNETVVLCHAPSFGRGGMRSNDIHAAPGCCCCHDKLDGRSPWDGGRGTMKYGTDVCTSAQLGYEKIEAWFHAVDRWQQALIKKGLITITGVETKLTKLLPRRM